MISERATKLALKVEAFVRNVVIPYERDHRSGPHGSTTELVQELREKARTAGVLTPHILEDERHLSQLETVSMLVKSGLSPLGPVACNTMAPNEGNMYLLGHVATSEQKDRRKLIIGAVGSYMFFQRDQAKAQPRTGIDVLDAAAISVANPSGVVLEAITMAGQISRFLRRPWSCCRLSRIFCFHRGSSLFPRQRARTRIVRTVWRVTRFAEFVPS